MAASPDREQAVLLGAVRLACSDQALAELARYLIQVVRPHACITVEAASAAAGVTEQQLLRLVRGNDAFRLSDGGTLVSLQPEAFKARARAATATGVLFAELLEPVGFVDGIHPIRLGARCRGVTDAHALRGRGNPTHRPSPVDVCAALCCRPPLLWFLRPQRHLQVRKVVRV
jgi:hypothetical protein